MNTQSHAILTYAVMRPLVARVGSPAETGRVNTTILCGALCPDLPLYLFFGWYSFVERASQQVIWTEYYFDPRWTLIFDFTHSFPLWTGGLAAGLWLKRSKIALFMGAGLLSSVEDILVHFDDGHAHLFPFSDYRFASPVSYWDPAHHGTLFSLFEAAVVTAVSFWAFKRIHSWWGKALLVLGVLSLWATNLVWATIFALL